jgi:hypothetical protein
MREGRITINDVTTTLYALENQVRAMLDEPVAAQWTQLNLRIWMNEGIRDLARSTRHFKSTYAQSLTAGVAEYTMPESVITVEHCYYDDGARKMPLWARHYEQMDQIWGERQDNAGAWPQWFTTWGYAPNLKLRLYPVPSITGHTARLLTATIPSDMPLSGSDTTAVDVPPAWVDLISDYAEMKALRRDRDPRWQEALEAYTGKRDAMIHNNDYLAVNREIVPDPSAGYMARWLVDDGY